MCYLVLCEQDIVVSGISDTDLEPCEAGSARNFGDILEPEDGRAEGPVGTPLSPPSRGRVKLEIGMKARKADTGQGGTAIADMDMIPPFAQVPWKKNPAVIDLSFQTNSGK